MFWRFCCSYIKSDYPPTNSEFIATMAETIKLNLGKSGNELYNKISKIDGIIKDKNLRDELNKEILDKDEKIF